MKLNEYTIDTKHISLNFTDGHLIHTRRMKTEEALADYGGLEVTKYTGRVFVMNGKPKDDKKTKLTAAKKLETELTDGLSVEDGESL